jgi:serine/threonine-protein kinase
MRSGRRTQEAGVPTVPEVSQNTFLTLLRQSGLIEPVALEAALADAPNSPRSKHLARHLVKKELLTRFQAQQLLAGRSGGFILGQYRILDQIGQGGMGKVYKAEHQTMSRTVALKVLSSDVTRTERARQLFRREVKAAARLVHPNIATAFDANEVNGRAFLVLEYISGPSLSSLVKEQGPLPIGQACEFIRQAALGLQHAHEFGMVHRDIKPSNLLIQPPVGRDTLEGGTLKIVDFGLALLADGSDDALTPDRHVVLGTPDYLSPEQARDLRDVDIRSDIYSLGCTFYWLLTGQVPFPGGTAIEKLNRHAQEEPQPVEGLRPLIPLEVANIVRRMMAKKPEQRYQTPRELADELAQFSVHQPMTWTRRHTDPFANIDSDQLPRNDDPSDPSSTLGFALSGTLSLAEIASTLASTNRGGFLESEPEPDKKLRSRFLMAVALGFALGIALIIGAGLVR